MSCVHRLLDGRRATTKVQQTVSLSVCVSASVSLFRGCDCEDEEGGKVGHVKETDTALRFRPTDSNHPSEAAEPQTAREDAGQIVEKVASEAHD